MTMRPTERIRQMKSLRSYLTEKLHDARDERDAQHARRLRDWIMTINVVLDTEGRRIGGAKAKGGEP